MEEQETCGLACDFSRRICSLPKGHEGMHEGPKMTEAQFKRVFEGEFLQKPGPIARMLSEMPRDNGKRLGLQPFMKRVTLEPAYSGDLPPNSVVGEIKTFTGRRFHPLAPRSEEVDILDIAHALSNACRFSGHTRKFYSVGQHALYVSFLVPEEHALAGLLHDSSEAYLVDMPSPVKQHPSFAFYRSANKILEDCINGRFDLPLEMHPEVKKADRLMLYTEQRDLCGGAWDMEPKFAPFSIRPLSANDTRALFIWRYLDLTEMRDTPYRLNLNTIQERGCDPGSAPNWTDEARRAYLLELANLPDE